MVMLSGIKKTKLTKDFCYHTEMNIGMFVDSEEDDSSSKSGSSGNMMIINTG